MVNIFLFQVDISSHSPRIVILTVFFTFNLDTENDTHQTLSNTSDVAQLQDTQHENVHNVDEIDETRNSAEQLLTDPDSSDGVPVQNTQDESVVDVDHVDIENESIGKETKTSAEQLSVLGRYFQKDGKKKDKGELELLKSQS